MTLKIVALAPMPIARAAMAMAVNPGARRSTRSAYEMSRMTLTPDSSNRPGCLAPYSGAGVLERAEQARERP